MLVLINAVGLTPQLLPYAPKLQALANRQWQVALHDVVPAVTMSAQATILTGKSIFGHGIVGNGWLFRDTNEVRFWQQSNRLMQAEPLYQTAKDRAKLRRKVFRVAKMFWWFNQGANVDFSVTPKPHYGIDGNKIFGIHGHPQHLVRHLEEKFGPFPFHTFWGPKAGLPCTQWIAQASAEVIQKESPDLTLIYLPHLDYDPQRYGPSGADMRKLVQELDDACTPILDIAEKKGAQVWVVSEYGHCDVDTPVYLNRELRREGWLEVRNGPFGEQIDLFQSRAFAVCDHQLAHIYINNPDDIKPVASLIKNITGVSKILVGEERSAFHLNHSRSGEIIALSQPKSWFAYPFWLNDEDAPDYARTVAIHAKPGYDPCELFFDPKILFPKLKVIRKVIQKKLGFRMKLDVIPLDASIVKGSHGLPATNPENAPILIGTGPKPNTNWLPMENVHDLILNACGLG
ncbi:MAG: alkaline phosphatase family protein [Gemmataceae bacterium]|nr:alkaline phosphatase family protein [Gemmataceae bacterium]